jgi:ATP-dependent DNA helicase RecG
MDFNDLLDSLKNPEHERVELKQSFADMDDIGRTIAAFATGQGGVIYVGVDRKGVPIGTVCDNEIRSKIMELATSTVRPPARVYVELYPFDLARQTFIITISVERTGDVHAYKGTPLLRDGDRNRVLTTDEVFQLKKTSSAHYFDEQPAVCDHRPALISDIDQQKIQTYFREYRKDPTAQIEVSRFLVNNQLTADGHMRVVNAAVMLFGTQPESFVPQCRIRISAFEGTTVTDASRKNVISGDLFELTMFELAKYNANHSFLEGAKRIDVPEYPVEALRELVINAIVHRDYYERNTDIFIKLFADRIEITNPASFPFERFTFAEIKSAGISKRRNPLIATFFERAGLMEQEGRGLRRVEALAKEHGLPAPIMTVSDNLFQVTIYNSAKNKELIRNSPFARVRDMGQLNPRQLVVMQNLFSNPRSIGLHGHCWHHSACHGYARPGRPRR